MSDNEEHTILEAIFKRALDEISDNNEKGKLPHARTSVLPHVLNLAESIMVPMLREQQDAENFNDQLFAIAASFRWTIQKMMPIDKFIEWQTSSRMVGIDKLMNEYTARMESITEEEIDAGVKGLERVAPDKKRELPGIG